MYNIHYYLHICSLIEARSEQRDIRLLPQYPYLVNLYLQTEVQKRTRPSDSSKTLLQILSLLYNWVSLNELIAWFKSINIYLKIQNISLDYFFPRTNNMYWNVMQLKVNLSFSSTLLHYGLWMGLLMWMDLIE